MNYCTHKLLFFKAVIRVANIKISYVTYLEY